MKPQVDSQGGTFTVTIPGDLVSSVANPLRSEMNSLLDAPDPAAKWQLLRLDLTAANMVDSVGLNFIVTLLKAAQKHQARMQILYASQNVYRAFIFTRLDRHVELIKA